jgi:hypothetical protein
MEYKGNSRSNSGSPQTQSGSPPTQSGPRDHRLSDQSSKGRRLTRRVGGLPPHQAGEPFQNRKREERPELRYPFAAIRAISSECRLDFARRRGVTATVRKDRRMHPKSVQSQRRRRRASSAPNCSLGLLISAKTMVAGGAACSAPRRTARIRCYDAAHGRQCCKRCNGRVLAATPARSNQARSIDHCRDHHCCYRDCGFYPRGARSQRHVRSHGWAASH